METKKIYGSKNRKQLYDNLSKDYNLGTFEDFDRNMNNDEVRLSIYHAGKDAGWDLPDYDQFSRDMAIRMMNIAGKNQEVDHATYEDFVRRHPSGTNVKPKPKPVVQQSRPAANTSTRPAAKPVIQTASTQVSPSPVSKQPQKSDVVKAENGMFFTEGGLDSLQKGYPAVAVEGPTKVPEPPKPQLNVPYKPDWQLTAAERDKIYHENDFVAQQMKRLDDSYQRYHDRRSQPLVDTGNPDANKSVIKTQGQWEDEMNKGVRELADKYVSSSVTKALEQAEDKWFSSMAESSMYPMKEGAELDALRRANKEIDPDKVLKGLQESLKAAYSNPEMIKDINKRADELGIPRDVYMEQVVVPYLQGQLADEFTKKQIEKYMPKNTAMYVLQGMSNSIGGMLMSFASETKSQRAYKNQAAQMTEEGENPYYNPGTGAKLAQMGVSFAADAPFFGLYGKVSGQVVKKIAEHEIKKMVAKGLSEQAARSIVGTALERSVGARMKQYLMQHVISGSLTMGAYNATSEGARQMRDDDYSLGRLASSTGEGLLTGAAFGVTGGASQALSQNLTGLSRIGAKIAGFGAEAETLYATEELAKMAHGEDAFENPFLGSLEALEKLGVMKLSGGHLLGKAGEKIIRAKEVGVGKATAETVAELLGANRTGVKFDKEEESYVRNTVEGNNLIQSLMSMHPEVAVSEVNGKRQLTPEGEQMRRQLAQNYDEFMSNQDIPANVKQKVAAVLGGVYRPGLEVGADVVQYDNGSTYVKTRDKDGNCVRDIKFDNYDDALAFQQNLKSDIKRNDAVNMWNSASQNVRKQIVDAVRSEVAGEQQIADALDKTNGMKQNRLKRQLDKVNKLREHYEGREMDEKEAINFIETIIRDGNDEVFNDLYETILEKAHPADELDTKRNYYDGTQVSPLDRHLALADQQVAEERLHMYGDEFAQEVMDAADYPDEKMAELAMRLSDDEITADQLKAAMTYYNASAKVMGMMDEAIKTVDNEVRAANQKVMRDVHPDSGMLITGTARQRPVYVTAGHFEVAPDGRLIPTDNSGAVIVRDIETGEIDVLNPNDVLVTAINDPKRILEANDSMDGLRGQLMKQVDESIEYAPGTPDAPEEMGEIFVGYDGKSYMVTGEQDETGNFVYYKIPVDENGVPTGEKPLPFDNEEYRKYKSNQIDATNRPEEETVLPGNTQEVEQEIVPEAEISPEQPVQTEVPQVEQVVNTGSETGLKQDNSNELPVTTESRIPVDEKGRKLYEQATPEDALADLTEKYGEETAQNMIGKMVDNNTRLLDDLLATDTSKLTDMNDIDAHQQQIADVQRKIDFWKSLQKKEEPIQPVVEETSVQPVVDETPHQKATPEKTEQPVIPFRPQESVVNQITEFPPVQPGTPEQPVAAEAPKQAPVQPETPKQSVTPETPKQSVTPETPEQPVAAEAPEQAPVQPETPKQSVTTEAPKQNPAQPQTTQQTAIPETKVSQKKAKLYQKTVEANRGRTFTFTAKNGTRSVLTVQRIDHEGNVVVARRDYDAQGNAIGAIREERYPFQNVGQAILDNTWKKELSTDEKLRKSYKYSVGDVPILDVLTDEEKEQLLPLVERNDKESKEAIGVLTSEFIKNHRDDLILKGRDTRNERVGKAFARSGRGERLRGVREQYRAFEMASQYLTDEAMQPTSIEEYVAEALGDVPKRGDGFLAYESYDQGGNEIVGLKDESGFGGRGFGGDTKGFAPWLAPKGKGISLKQFAEQLHESLPEGLKEQYSDQDLRNIIRDVLTGAEKPTDISNMILRNRAEQAEAEARHEEDTWMEMDAPVFQKMATDNTFGGRLKRSKDEVNTEPSEAQKDAGNYKKGHISFGGYDFTIENPAGSMRRGKDANQKPWEQKMNNTYGYILGKYGKDGDHLDMFINDNADLDNWNGTVYVIDQVTPDGKFDEHKVMYGFDSEAEARDAYLSNYQKGWKGLGNITGVSKEIFDKWLDSSKRKMVEFADHSIIKKHMAERRDTAFDDALSKLDEREISIDDPKLLKEYGLKNVTLSRYRDYVTLTHFVVDRQGEGNGTRFMEDLARLADEKGWTLALTPDTSFGATSQKRLKDFYKRFGFKDNRGRNTDFNTRESMIRRPQDYHPESPEEQERVIRDAVVEHLRQAGIEVSNDWKEGQRILDEYNSRHEAVSPDEVVKAQKVEKPIFVSNALKAVEGIKQDKGTPEQWLAMITKNGGLKAGEDKWIGLSDWLKEQKGSVTKQDILDYIRKNQIQVAEVPYKEQIDVIEDALERKYPGFNDAFRIDEEYDEYFVSIKDPAKAVELYNNLHKGKTYADTDEEIRMDYDGSNLSVDQKEELTEWAQDELIPDAETESNDRPIESTRLRYTTEGLDNKREIALVVPTIEPYNENDHIHFGDAGGGRAVAWIRFGETTDTDGNRVLVIDEIQSKRHQEGRDKGYKRTLTKEEKKELSELEEKYNDLQELKKQNGKNIKELKRIHSEESLIVDRMQELENISAGIGIPDAPFEKNWHELAMKRMLRYAAENGYDKIAWTTGEQQAERYDIGNVVESIQWENEKKGKGVRIISGNHRYDLDLLVGENGEILDVKQEYGNNDNLVGKSLSDVVGKGFADNIMNDKGKEHNVNLGPKSYTFYSIEGDNLRIGADGMKGFYDRMLPSFMNKYGKKWGVKVGEVELPDLKESARKMWSVDVTPEMKESVMEGQPMFFRTPDGQAYGYTYKGEIYIDPRIATSETPVHEYSHLWAEMKRQTAPEEWNHIKQVMLGDKLVQPIIDRVRRDYPELAKEGKEDDFIEEIITQFSGKRGSERLREIANEVAQERGGIFGKAEAVTAMQRLKSILNRFWEGVAKMMGWKYRNANQIADRILADMLNGVNPREEIAKVKESVKSVDDIKPAKVIHLNAKEVKMPKKQIEDYYTEGLTSKDSINMSNRVNNMSPKELVQQYKRLNDQMLDENGLNVDEQEEVFRQKWFSEHGIEGFGKASADFFRQQADKYTFNKMALRWDILERIEELGLDAYIGKDLEGTANIDDLPDKRETAEIVRMQKASKPDKDHKKKQLEIVIRENPMQDDYHTGIRSVDDIKTFKEVYEEGKKEAVNGGWNEYASNPDVTNEMIEEALKTGKIVVYSSYPINNGTFVTPSLMMAKDYAGNGRVYPRKVALDDVAWISLDEGQYANLKEAPKFQMVGKRGAENADWNDRDTKRMDNLKLAEEAEKAGHDAHEIKFATGWERGKDGKWRYETMDTIADVVGVFENEYKIRNLKLRELGRKQNDLQKKYERLSASIPARLDSRYSEEQKAKYRQMRKERENAWKEYRKASDEYDKYKDEMKEGGVKLSLGEVLGYDNELFKYYPDFKDISVVVSGNMESNTAGSFEGDTIKLNINELNRFRERDLANENVMGTLIHEIQHAVQDVEGFAQGGSLYTSTTEEGINAIVAKKRRRQQRLKISIDANNRYLSSEEDLQFAAELDGRTIEEERKHLQEENKKLAQDYDNLELQIKKLLYDKAPSLSDARELYYNLAGEVEARNATRRMDMSEEERMTHTLEETESVYRNDQVVIMGDGTSMNINDIKPVGKGDFGDIYDQFKGHPKEAIDFLLKKKGGEVIGALSHKDIGDIDLVWGEEGSGKSDGFGLAKLAKFHPEVLDNLQEILDDMHIVKRTENRINLESDTHKAAVRLTWNEKKKNWLLTAFEKKNSALDNTTDTGKTSDRGKRNDTTTPLSTVSDGKDTKNINSLQGKSEKSSIQGLDGYTEKDVTDLVRQHFEDLVGEDGLKIVDMKVIGSRKDGRAKEGSDLDVLLEYDGDMSEDGLFNILNDENNRLYIEGVPVDINPITKDKSGTIAEFMKRNADYTKDDEGPRFQRSGQADSHAEWETAMNKWKERNAIAADAEGPGEKPKYQHGETAMEYAKRMGQWYRARAIWQTAPKLQDYEQSGDDMTVADEARAREQRYPDSESAKRQRIAADLARLRHAMSRQKTYDKATVKAVTDYAQEMMKQGFGDNLGRGEMQRMLSSVKNATGAKDIKKQLDNIMNILMDNQLKNLENRVWKLASVKELKQTAQGVEAQGKLELKGQRMIQAFREATQSRMTAGEIRNRMAEVAEKMERNDEEAPMWEQEYEGLSIALQYADNIEVSRKEWADLDREYKDAVKEYKGSGRTYQEQQELLESIDQAMQENKIERIGLYGDIIGRLEGDIAESIEGAKEFVEREKQRVANIHRIANYDLAGKDMGAIHQNTTMKRLSNSSAARFFLGPLATFEQMLKQFGSRSAKGEGYLYDYFMRNWMKSIDEAYANETKAKEELDAKAREVFGNKVKRWSDLYELERKLPTMDVEIIDQGTKKKFTLNQGNLLYIYMADKMADGRMKLRNQGITEEDVQAIADFLDPRLKALGDWLQDEYLVNKRTEYNKVHERMFGAPMAAIENYFPIKILGDARVQEQDVNVPDSDTLPSTITGSIVKRRKNTLPLDILNTDALSLAIEHVEDMERWAAQAEWNRDVNTLLSYTTFRNKVKNMNTIYGSGDQLWNRFKDAAKMAAGTYKPKSGEGSVDKAISNVAKGVTAAKINFRVYTAFKQILSAPAFLHDVNLGDFVKDSLNPYGSWKWAMENLPVFKKRWKSRQVGDTRLMDDPTDWKLWKTNVVQMATRIGMSPNALVDGVTCAVGAKAIYESRYKKYKKIGASDEVARKRALQDAEIGYNLTQQSSEGAFVSQIQKDRTVAANMLSVFRNSSMSYTRQWVDALRNLHHMSQKGYKDDAIHFMSGQFQEQLGLSKEKADEAAKKEYARTARHEVARLLNMMFGVTFAWNLGASLPYLLIGDDDKTKEEMLKDAAVRSMIAGPTEGFASGNLFSEFIASTIANEQTRKAFNTEGWGAAFDTALKQGGDYEINPLPLMADIQGMIKKMGYDRYAAAQDVFNIAMQSAVGVNPQTFTDIWNACLDYGNPDWMPFTSSKGNDDLANSKEIALFIMRLMNAPTSSWRNKYIDELGMEVEDAKKLSYDEMAERYANYKHWKDAPMMGWLRSDEARQEKMGKIRKQFDEAVMQRMERLADNELMRNVARSEDPVEKRMYAKLIAKRLGVTPGPDSKEPTEEQWYQAAYQNHMLYEDIREDEILAAKRKEIEAYDKSAASKIDHYLKWIREGQYDEHPNGKKKKDADLRAPGKKQFGTDYSDEQIMADIRKWRKEALEIALKVPTKKSE